MYTFRRRSLAPPPWQFSGYALEEKPRRRRCHFQKPSEAKKRRSKFSLMAFRNVTNNGPSSFYPKLLCANTRSSFLKMDNISSILLLKQIDCFVATETWFRDHHSDSLVSIPGYCCSRDDRKDRIGGGVAIWTRHHLCTERVTLSCKPNDIEAVAVKISPKLLVIGCYVPPQAVNNNHCVVKEFIIDLIDDALNEDSSLEVILCGDFNRLNVNDICRHCNLVNLNEKPTYGNAELDYILLSEDLAANYTVCTAEPIDNSSTPHVSLLATQASSQGKCLRIQRKVFDLRDSNVSNFLQLLGTCDWKFLEEASSSLNTKCNQFHQVLEEVVNATIPAKIVTFTEGTKPWVTPLLKSIINDQWNAYRERNFSLYNHLKTKIKREIKKSKIIWIKKMKKTNIWKAINSVCPKKTCNSIQCIYSKYNSITDAANDINQNLVRTFSQRKTVPKHRIVPPNCSSQQTNHRFVIC
ncbi:MAG: endonuclease/exonuclease/phosphatase family protein [Pseudomonadota bacterium]